MVESKSNMEETKHMPKLKVRPGELEDQETFCPNRWVRLLKELSENPEKLDIEDYVAHLYESTNLFKSMGSAMSMAF